MKANYVTKMERSSEGKYIEKEVKEKKNKNKEEKKHHQTWRVDIKSVRSCLDSVDHHISKKKAKTN